MKKTLAFLLALMMLCTAFCACKVPADTDLPDEGENSDENNIPDEGDGGESDDLPVKPTVSLSDSEFPEYKLSEWEYRDMRTSVRDWFYKSLESGTLFSLQIKEEKFADIFSRMKKEQTVTNDEDGNELVTVVYTDNPSKFKITVEAKLYAEVPTVDYLVYLEYTGKNTSVPVSEVYPLCSSFELGGELTLNTARGSAAKASDFEPISNKLAAGEKFSFAPAGARSSSNQMPYFDVIGKDSGVLVAIGWNGQWSAEFSSKGDGIVDMTAGQQEFSSVFLPGEKIRTPRIVVTYFDGDAEYGHNVFRETMIRHYSPPGYDGEEQFSLPFNINFWGGVLGEFMIDVFEAFNAKGINVNGAWMDAGWNADYDAPAYGNRTAVDREWDKTLGWWTINEKLFENGSLRSVGDAGDKYGINLMLWHMIEDGRLDYADKFTFGRESYYSHSAGSYSGGPGCILNLADEDVYKTVFAYFSNLIDNEGVDWIRVDQGTAPLAHMKKNDKDEEAELELPDGYRLGMTENKHVTNFYRLWSELYEKYPGRFLLDNCASGGRRLDIEMASLGIPLWRTDYPTDDLEAQQTQGQWLSYWIPYHAIGVVRGTSGDYTNYSYFAPSVAFTPYDLSDEALTKLKAYYDDFNHLKKYWYGDYYQLIEPSLDVTKDQAYQLYRKDMEKGMVVMFKRSNAANPTVKALLKGLDPTADYVIHDMGDDECKNDVIMSGDELMRGGLSVSFSGINEAKIYEISMIRE